ncbi:Os12g0293000, partial [Oryza sativa Japonica Group]
SHDNILAKMMLLQEWEKDDRFIYVWLLSFFN